MVASTVRLAILACVCCTACAGKVVRPATEALLVLPGFGWTFNPLQERAPRIAVDRLGFLTWVRYGSPVADVARTPYPPLTAPHARVALMVETKPTSFITRYSHIASNYGPYRFECDSFGERYDDCLYLPMDHDEVYVRFAEIWPELLAFIRTGRFTSTANRTPPDIHSSGTRR